MTTFSDPEIAAMAAEIDAQLLELRSLSSDVFAKSGDQEAQLIKQNEAMLKEKDFPYFGIYAKHITSIKKAPQEFHEQVIDRMIQPFTAKAQNF